MDGRSVSRPRHDGSATHVDRVRLLPRGQVGLAGRLHARHPTRQLVQRRHLPGLLSRQRVVRAAYVLRRRRVSRSTAGVRRLRSPDRASGLCADRRQRSHLGHGPQLHCQRRAARPLRSGLQQPIGWQQPDVPRGRGAHPAAAAHTRDDLFGVDARQRRLLLVVVHGFSRRQPDGPAVHIGSQRGSDRLDD